MNHTHKFETLNKNLICPQCKTVTTVEDAIENAKEAGKDELRTELLMSHSLKKFAHEATYNLLQSKHFPIEEIRQERLL